MSAEQPAPIVLDTNVVLDMWLFGDPHTPQLRTAIENGALCWHATPRMRDELVRVLTYPHLMRVMQRLHVSPDAVLAAFDRHAHIHTDPVPPCAVTCKDRDDQGFLDLAVAHTATLVSKDKLVLRLRRPLAKLGASVLPDWPPQPETSP